MQRTLGSRSFISAVCSTVLSGLYIFTLKARQHISPGRLPEYPDRSESDDLYLVVGEAHIPRKLELTIPERGLFTGIIVQTRARKAPQSIRSAISRLRMRSALSTAATSPKS